MEKFSLFNVALYAKGWYLKEHKQDIWKDLKVMLTLDDYSGEIMTKKDVTNLILYHCGRLDIRAFNDLSCFADGISADNAWRYGYETKYNRPFLTSKEENDSLPEYDYHEAIVRYCLSAIKNTMIDKLVGDLKLPKPNYKLGLRKPKHITTAMLKQHFPDNVKTDVVKVETIKLNWSNVFNTKQWLDTLSTFTTIDVARKRAKDSGYAYFIWNDVVYNTNGERLECTQEDINTNSSNCLINL